MDKDSLEQFSNLLAEEIDELDRVVADYEGGIERLKSEMEKVLFAKQTLLNVKGELIKLREEG